MRVKLFRRPSGSMIVAIVALVVAASGTAVAASSLIKGDSLIKKRSLSGNRLRNHTITGTQVNLNKLGKVPNAKNADSASHANTANRATIATTAGTAGNATTATVANNLAGLTRWRTTVATPGASSAAPNVVALAAVGPFTIIGECWIAGSNTDAATFIRTSAAGSATQGYSGMGLTPFGPTDGTKQISEDTASGNTATHAERFLGPDDGSWVAETPDGSLTLDGFGAQGVYMQGASGPACSFSGFLITQ
jgi:hypothetical protein